ncbi:hypothetical protein Tco_0849410 [Tanacetum coccineum]
MKRKLGRKESVSKQGRKNAKPGPTLDDSTFDDLDADHGMDYMDTEEPVNEGMLSKDTEELNVTHDTKVLEKGGSNEEPVSAAGNTGVSTAVPEASTATLITLPTTTSVFEDEDIFLADALVMLSDKTKLKGVAIKEVKESDRPKRSILILKPLPSIDPKDKGKGVLKESPVKKVKRSDLDAAQIAKDAEVARLVYEEELAELEKEKEERHRQEQASVDYIANLYDEKQIQALYIKEQERAADFVPIGFEKDERMIEKMNKKATGVDEEEMKATKKSRRQKTDFDLEKEEQLKAFLMIVPNEEGEIDYEVLGKRVVFELDGSSRFFKDFQLDMVSKFDRLDFIELIKMILEDQEEWKTLERMLALRLIAEFESEAVLIYLDSFKSKLMNLEAMMGVRRIFKCGCAETKVATWDDLAFKLIILGWNVKHRIDPWKRISDKRTKNQAKNDKTEHGMEKHGKDKSNRSQRPKSQQKSKSRPEPVSKNT